MSSLRSVFSPIATGDASQQSALAALLLDGEWGLLQASRRPALQELCIALGEHYASVARGTGSSKGLINLIPLLMEEAAAELRHKRAPLRDQKVLLALRLIWACPKLGPRGLRVARKAWMRVWGRGEDAPKRFPIMG